MLRNLRGTILNKANGLDRSILSEDQNALPQISYPEFASLGFLFQQGEGMSPSDDQYWISLSTLVRGIPN